MTSFLVAFAACEVSCVEFGACKRIRGPLENAVATCRNCDKGHLRVIAARNVPMVYLEVVVANPQFFTITHGGNS